MPFADSNLESRFSTLHRETKETISNKIYEAYGVRRCEEQWEVVTCEQVIGQPKAHTK